jgi:hypothetical protein
VIRRIPIACPPIPGESFDSWLEAYARRLDVTNGAMAGAIGLDRPLLLKPTRLLLAEIPDESLAEVTQATHVPASTLPAMLTSRYTTTVCELAPTRSLRRLWRPRLGSLFCPACLAETGGRWQLAWRLPWNFYCPAHRCLLASFCPDCGRPPRARSLLLSVTPPASGCSWPSRHINTPTGAKPVSCGFDLSTTPLEPATAAAIATAQHQLTAIIDRLVAGDARPGALVGRLLDICVVARHVDKPSTRWSSGRPWGTLTAGSLVGAVGVIAGATGDADPLTTLLPQPGGRRHDAIPPSGRRHDAIPPGWKHTSPTLRRRIARLGGPGLSTTAQLRYAVHLQPRLADTAWAADSALGRAAWVPDQLWVRWSMRTLPDGLPRTGTLRSSAAVALLLPGTGRPFSELVALLNPGITDRTVPHHLREITKTPQGQQAIQALTALAIALDTHAGQPGAGIDYARRRRLVAAVELLPDDRWKHMCGMHAVASGGSRKLALARLYLYELLTGGDPQLAPAPYRRGETATVYNRFAITLPAGLATALTAHAQATLADADGDPRFAGVASEPVTWEPPLTWVSGIDWPGIDPDLIDLEPAHSMLRRHPTRFAESAESCRFTLDDLRTLLIHNHKLRVPSPARRPPRVRRILDQQTRDHIGTLYFDQHRPMRAISRELTLSHQLVSRTLDELRPQRPPALRKHSVDPAWLAEQYLTQRRTLNDIAAQTGMSPVTLATRAREAKIPLRGRGGASHADYIRRGPEYDIDPVWLADEYLTKQRSLPAIANQLGVDYSVVAHAARKHRIPRRSRSEAGRLSYRQGVRHRSTVAAADGEA